MMQMFYARIYKYVCIYIQGDNVKKKIYKCCNHSLYSKNKINPNIKMSYV